MELFDFGIPALDKALNLTATVLLLLALGMLLIRVILRLCDRAFDRSERLAPFRTYLRSTLRAVLYILLALAVLGSIGVEITSFVALRLLRRHRWCRPRRRPRLHHLHHRG